MSVAAGISNGTFGRVALLDIDRPVQRHAHPHAHLLYKIDGADSEFRVRDRLLPLADDTAILVNPWEPHDYPHARLAPRSLILALYIEPDWLAEVDDAFDLSATPRFFPGACVTVPKNLVVLLHDTADLLLSGRTSLHGLEHLLAELMCEVISSFSDWRCLRSTVVRKEPDVRDSRVRRAIELMTRQAGEPHVMELVARESALSRAHFFELFRANTGMSPLLFSHALRMEASYQALLYGDDSVASIAERLKFPAPAHFTRFFRGHLGVTPSEFRRALWSAEPRKPLLQPLK